VLYPLSLIVISVTSCCVGLSLRSRDCQTGSGSGSRCDVVTSSKRASNGHRGASDDDDAETPTAQQVCQLNCDQSQYLRHRVVRRWV